MQNHLTIRPGKLTRAYADGTVDEFTSGITSSYEQVRNFSTANGDKKAPNNHRYTIERGTAYTGSDLRFDANGRPVYTDSGNLDLSRKYVFDRVSNSLPNNYDSLYNVALERVYDKLRGSLDLSIAMAELNSTRRLIKSIGSLSSYVTRNASWLKGSLKGSGKNWLKYNLGWRPLVQDVYGALDELYNYQLGGLLQVRGSANQKVDKLWAIFDSPDQSKFIPADCLEGVRFHLQYKSKDGLNVSRWTSLNPVSIAWELLPYSFVVDYFYDVGGMIRSLETSLLYDSDFVSGYMTHLKVESCSHRLIGLNRKNSGGYFISDASSSMNLIDFRRLKLTSSPLPKLPTFKLPRNSSQLLTMAALLSQHLR
jgi:hypothetical protein